MLVLINEQGFYTRKPVRRWKYQHGGVGGYANAKNILDEEIALFISFLVKHHPTYIQMTEQPSPQSVYILFSELTSMKIDGLVLVYLF